MLGDALRKVLYSTMLVLMLGLIWALAADQSEAERFARIVSRPRPDVLNATVRATEPTTNPQEAAELVVYLHQAMNLPAPSFYLTSVSALVPSAGI
jgi:hypothetical protein